MSRERVQRIIKELGVRAEMDGIGTLNEEERDVLVPYWARGIIGNGGFKYFFEGTYDLADVARRFRQLKLESVAAASDAVLAAVFPAGPPAGAKQREEALSRADWSQFELEEDAVFDLTWEALESAIAAYVLQHPRVGRPKGLPPT